MSVREYRATYWFPDGSLAAGVPARVFPEGSNALAQLYTDITGTTPLPNPVSTDNMGVLNFWADEGQYWINIDTRSFLVDVGMSQEQARWSTGIASGGRISTNLTNPLAVDISPVDGYIVDFTPDDETQPVVTRVETSAQTVPLDAAALTRTATWFLMDASGTVLQQAFPATPVQRRQYIALGAAAQDGAQIFRTLPDAVLLNQPANQLADLMDALGLFVTRPLVITPNANLTFATSGGTLFARSLNRYSGGLPTNDPHEVVIPAASPAQFRYITSTGSTFGPLRTTLDVNHYDVGGVVTPIGGGTNTSSIHRLWVAGTGSTADQFAFQYGQSTYSTLSDAVARIGRGGFTTNPVLAGSTALVAWIAVTRTATNLTDPAQAVIVPAGKFAAP